VTLAERLVVLLRERKETLGVAESLTGGLLAATLVEVPGASVVFRGGIVAYATDLKASLVGVPAGLLEERGPVDPDVAAALAEGARDRCGATWGLSTTGVAGPTPQGGHEVGVVYLGLCGPGAAEVRSLRLTGSRSQIRVASVTAALDLLHSALTSWAGVSIVT
jgi:nicotinamide-nucleotide amidase